MDKTNLILNSTIELVDVQEEGNGKGRPFVSRFIEPGIAHYKELGDILITKETLNKFINTMVGCPVIIEHEDVTDANADKLRVGVVSRVWFNEMDGYFYCEGILTDPEAIDLVKNQGYNVSCAYSFVSDNTKRTHNGKEIDMEFIDGEFLHLALVKDPRYEGANIVVNKNDDVEWITAKGNHIPIKKGQSKDEAVKEFLEGKKSDAKDKQSDSKEKENKIKEDKKERTFIDKKTGKEQSLKDLVEKGLTPVRYGSSLWDNKPSYGIGDGKIEYKITEEEYKQALEHQKDKKNSDLQKAKEQSKDLTDYIKWQYNANIEPYITRRVGDKTLVEWDKLPRETQSALKRLDFDDEINLEQYSASEMSIGVKDKKIFENLEKNRQNIFEKKQSDSKTKSANNSIGDITMQVLNELKDFIKSVVSNEKEEEMKEVKNEDKRKLIDEVGGILKGKIDEELWRTVVGKLEKIAYEPSEDDKADNKAKNEEDEEKEAENKCKNEDDEEAKEDVTKNEDKPEDDGEDEEEDKPEDKAENKKVKNSMRDMVMGGSSNVQEQKLYISRKERLEEGNKY